MPNGNSHSQTGYDPTQHLKYLQKTIHWAKQHRIPRFLTYLLTAAAIASGITTYYTITQSSNPFGPNPNVVLGLVLIDLTLLLVLAVLVSRKVIGLWLSARKGSTGSRLQTRLVLLFALVAIVPTIIVAVFSALFFNFGIQSWFDQRVSTALEKSVSVAEAYREEHTKVLRISAQDAANQLSKSVQLLTQDPELFSRKLNTQIAIRSLNEGVVFWFNNNASLPSTQHQILAQSRFGFTLTSDLPPKEVIEKASTGEMVILKDPNEDSVQALVKLNNIANTYLLVGRIVDNKVIRYIEDTEGAAREYNLLKSKISDLQIKFSFIFILVAFLLLFVALWLAIIFSNFFTKPISNLITATQKVKAGDLSARVAEGPQNDELATLGRAFNRMAQQLEHQRHDLTEVNHQLDARNRFTEAVLSGVSAGVIALNSEKRIDLYNKTAANLLSNVSEKLDGRNLTTLIPALQPLFSKAEKEPNKRHQDQISIEHENQKRNLLVRISTEQNKNTIIGYVVTFDDITELVRAQRSAAWSDVARRIAHEIKNPLTPIHLAAERLKRKYSEESSNTDNFNNYVETITRHVSDIEKMVEEFANFARMPAPILKKCDITQLIKNSIFSQECRAENIHFILEIPQKPTFITCDERQIEQVLTNLCKNAIESLENIADSYKKEIHLTLEQSPTHITIEITDNGPGFPEELIDKLTEPYITTREKGTGLGLAIVKKIIDDHSGTLTLSNTSPKGASIKIILPL